MDVDAAIKSVPAWVVKPIYLLREALPLLFPIPIDWVDTATLYYHREVPRMMTTESGPTSP
jgi:hypothetical protein